MNSIGEFFTYNPTYQFWICKTCEYAVDAKTIVGHLTNKHRQHPSARTLAQRTAICAEAVNVGRNFNTNPFVPPSPDSRPIPGLPVYRGNCCQVENCQFTCRSVRTMQKHRRQVHHISIAAAASGRPRIKREEDSSINPNGHPVYCQRLTPSGNFSSFFIVTPDPAEVMPDPAEVMPDPAEVPPDPAEVPPDPAELLSVQIQEGGAEDRSCRKGKERAVAPSDDSDDSGADPDDGEEHLPETPRESVQKRAAPATPVAAGKPSKKPKKSASGKEVPIPPSGEWAKPRSGPEYDASIYQTPLDWPMVYKLNDEECALDVFERLRSVRRRVNDDHRRMRAGMIARGWWAPSNDTDAESSDDEDADSVDFLNTLV
ncbi:uncharacterized protein N7518_005744 [Penicillium psychrosexuale]|uniref:uncharacterized protein n=1 Tax=Penicillium psychrosexuale TaxID=1002107 RepID=UPI0025459FDF|nr:uncharacterized protein N7518_005744 [Penicillium psychrosexuale]KAJ5797204.1 hypothetical protein N7518_005744 [Penicillium psychrosexuale]